MKKNLTLKIVLLLVFTDCLETLTHFCFKRSVAAGSEFDVTNLPEVFLFLKSACLSPFLWLGLTSVLLTFIIWSTVLSRVDLSVAVPIASSSYIFVPLVSIIFLHEKISYLRWSGIFFILLGVILVSLTTQEKKGGLE
jgi:drug/metabolite transporter (DMT)-like permease